MKIIRYLLLILIFCTLLTSCGEEDTDVLRGKVESPDKKYTVTIVDYSYGALSPKGQKVYISNPDGSEKDEIVFIYGYENFVKWIDDKTLEINVYKVFNENNYIIKTMKDK